MQTSLLGTQIVLQPKTVRVDRTAVVAQLKVEVGTGGVARGTHVADRAPAINR